MSEREYVIAKAWRLLGGKLIKIKASGSVKVGSSPPDPVGGGSMVTAMHGKKPAGMLDMHADGEIAMVSVPDKYRRKGIARSMYRYAKKRGYNPSHSSERTNDGDAWARAVGGHMPTQGALSLHFRKPRDG